MKKFIFNATFYYHPYLTFIKSMAWKAGKLIFGDNYFPYAIQGVLTTIDD